MSDQPTKVKRYKAVVPSDHTILGTHFDGSRGYVVIYFNKTQLCPREPSEWVPATDYDDLRKRVATVLREARAHIDNPHISISEDIDELLKEITGE